MSKQNDKSIEAESFGLHIIYFSKHNKIINTEDFKLKQIYQNQNKTNEETL